jgi:hypothetical protein
MANVITYSTEMRRSRDVQKQTDHCIKIRIFYFKLIK